MYNLLIPESIDSNLAFCIRLAFSGGPEDATRDLARLAAASSGNHSISYMSLLSGARCIISKDGTLMPINDFQPLGYCAKIDLWREATRERFDMPNSPNTQGDFLNPVGGWLWSWKDEGWLAPVIVTNFKDKSSIRLCHAVETIVGWETDPICLETSGGPSLTNDHWINIAANSSDSVFRALCACAKTSGVKIFSDNRLSSIREKNAFSRLLPSVSSLSSKSI